MAIRSCLEFLYSRGLTECFRLSVAEEDAGDAEQDAAADARERPVRAGAGAAVPPAVSPLNNSETSRRQTWILC